jgi:PAS domain-containing protein
MVRYEDYDAAHDMWLEVTVTPISTGLALQTRDITARRNMQQALRASEERLRRYFELGLIGMAVTSPTKGILEVNDCLCAMLGYDRDDSSSAAGAS